MHPSLIPRQKSCGCCGYVRAPYLCLLKPISARDRMTGFARTPVVPEATPEGALSAHMRCCLTGRRAFSALLCSPRNSPLGVSLATNYWAGFWPSPYRPRAQVKPSRHQAGGAHKLREAACQARPARSYKTLRSCGASRRAGLNQTCQGKSKCPTVPRPPGGSVARKPWLVPPLSKSPTIWPASLMLVAVGLMPPGGEIVV